VSGSFFDDSTVTFYLVSFEQLILWSALCAFCCVRCWNIAQRRLRSGLFATSSRASARARGTAASATRPLRPRWTLLEKRVKIEENVVWPVNPGVTRLAGALSLSLSNFVVKC
jgi:hypothetical protein